MDIMLSSCAGMQKAEGDLDYDDIVKQLLDSYPEQNIISVLQGMYDAPFTIAQRLTFWNEKLRTGIQSKAEYDSVVTAIKNYRRE